MARSGQIQGINSRSYGYLMGVPHRSVLIARIAH